MLLQNLVAADRLAAIAPVLATAFMKATAVLAFGLVCSMLARGASAATRHLIWTLTLAGALFAPVVAAFVPRWTLPIAQWPFADRESARAPDVVAALPSAMVLAPHAVIAIGPVDASASADAVSATASPDVITIRAGDAVTVTSPRRRAVRVGVPVASASGEASTLGVTGMSADAVPAGGWRRAVAIVSTNARETEIASRGVTVTPDVAPVVVGAPAPPSTRPRVVAWLIAIWAIGAVIALVPTMLGYARLALIARHARPLDGGRWALLIPSVLRELDIRRHVRFVELDGAVMPMTWGLFRPVVLLPADDFDSTIEQRLDVLRHELAHVRRYDCLTQLIGQIACAMNWFNPLAWLAARRLRIERERACDDEVLRAGAKASDYADYLLRVARSTRIAGAAALGGLAMARPSQMAGRLMAVLDDRRRRGRVSPLVSAQAAAIASLVIAAVASAAPTSSVTPRIDVGRPTIATDVDVPEGRVTVASTPASMAPMPVSGTAPAEAAAIPAARISTGAVASSDVPVPSLLAVGLTSSAAQAPCDRTSRRGGNSSHTNWTSSDNGSRRWRVLWSEGDCSYELDARGEIKFNRDVSDIESISSGGSFTLEQHIGDDTKRLVVRPRSDGSLERTYSENGAPHEFDAGARAWFAEALIALDRQTAFAADQRVPAILERGGVDAVLQEVNLLASDYARRRYYTKLLSMRQLDRTQVRRVVEQAGSQMSSDYELAELLVAVSKLHAFSDDSHAAFVSAAQKIDSDYERRRALNALLQRDQLAPATVQALLEAASTIKSDYELAELLIDVSKRYAINAQTRPTYIQAVGSLKSDYEHRRVLAAIVSAGGLTPDVNRALLLDAARITSDYELAQFLIQIGKKGGLDQSTRDAYFAAADKIKSDYEHRRALMPLLTSDLLTKDLARAILASAAKIESDYECAELLVALGKAIPIDADLRPAFEKAAETIDGEYEYGRAMSAVRRR